MLTHCRPPRKQNSTNGTTQSTLLTALVNTALIGNYSPLGGKANVTGILNNGTYNGTEVSLLKYFNGQLRSTNRDGNATSVNFLDGGGADPLKQVSGALPGGYIASRSY